VTQQAPSLGRKIAEQAAVRPHDEVYVHVALDGTEQTLTWETLHRRSNQVAAALADKGLGLGDRIGIALRNSPAFTYTAFAAWKVGAIPIPIRWDLPDWELQRLREVVDPRVFVGADDLEWIESTTDLPPADLPDVTSPRAYGICSSGSTGTPKVIVVAAPGEFNDMYAGSIVDTWEPAPRPQTIAVLAPMYHVNAFVTLQYLLAGDRLVVLEKFEAARVVDVIERHRITTFTATPTMLQRIADLPGVDERDLSSLVWILQGAAPMPPSLVHRWASLIGAERIVMAYGMTESIGITALRGDEWMTHEGSVGKGFRGTEIRILDEDGKQVPTGSVGSIYLQSPTYGGSTYLGQAPQLDERDGFRTVGDVGYVDDDGYLYLVDRRVDLIISGGANVFPAEVETALIDHPAVADVVVVGLRDPEWGRRVHAIVEPADPGTPPTAGELIAYAKGRLAAYKVPKTIEFVERVPRSEATKVNRQRLVEARGG
jgi:bile acid-coenzyme A ligase